MTHPITVHTRALLGLQAEPVAVECHVSAGLPQTTIVGLAKGAVREARDRVRAALISSGFNYPDGRIVINLAPGHLDKSNSGLDLAIAVSLLAASRQIPSARLGGCEFFAELSLTGELQAAKGVLICALAAAREKRLLIMAQRDVAQAELLNPRHYRLAAHLRQVTDMLNGSSELAPAEAHAAASTQTDDQTSQFEQIVGQSGAKRALLIAAAGGHHLLMIGPPGGGKTMLARSLCELLPPLTATQQLRVAANHSVAGLPRRSLHQPPFRDPHHSATAVALLGGGNPPYPGEITLADQGVLFLDELPHFAPSTLNALREPIETGSVALARANYRVQFPSEFQLVAAMNPCPAGRICRQSACRCQPHQVMAYQARISGPLLDRIDLHVPVAELSPEELTSAEKSPLVSRQVSDYQSHVAGARQRQQDRQGCLNALLTSQATMALKAQADVDEDFLARAVSAFQLTARSYQKLWRIARTIADLEQSDSVYQAHIAEALTFRSVDWERQGSA